MPDDRDTMIDDRDALTDVFEQIDNKHGSVLFPDEMADCFLASDWLANDRRAVAAQALRDAATQAVQDIGWGVADWLRDRADSLGSADA